MRPLAALALFLSVFAGCATSPKLPPVRVEPYRNPMLITYKPDPKPIRVSVQTARNIMTLRRKYDEIQTENFRIKFLLKGCEFKAKKPEVTHGE